MYLSKNEMRIAHVGGCSYLEGLSLFVSQSVVPIAYLLSINLLATYRVAIFCLGVILRPPHCHSLLSSLNQLIFSQILLLASSSSFVGGSREEADP